MAIFMGKDDDIFSPTFPLRINLWQPAVLSFRQQFPGCSLATRGVSHAFPCRAMATWPLDETILMMFFVVTRIGQFLGHPTVGHTPRKHNKIQHTGCIKPRKCSQKTSWCLRGAQCKPTVIGGFRPQHRNTKKCTSVDICSIYKDQNHK